MLLSKWKNVIPSKYLPPLLFGLLHFDWSTMHPYGPFPWSLHSSTFSTTLPNPRGPHLPPPMRAMFIKQGRYIYNISSILGDKSVKIKKKPKKFQKNAAGKHCRRYIGIWLIYRRYIGDIDRFWANFPPTNCRIPISCWEGPTPDISSIYLDFLIHA